MIRGREEASRPHRRGPEPFLTFGFPRMHKEPGERRDFLPSLVAAVAGAGCAVFVESGTGGAMGYSDDDYRACSPLVRVVDERTAFAQDVVVVLRARDERFSWMRPGATLVSMLHLPTRRSRISRLVELHLEAISLDSIVDDNSCRLVENMRAVGWNGLEAAFDALTGTHPAFAGPSRGPIRVTVIGTGIVGKHAIEAATKYGNLRRNQALSEIGLPGVAVTVLGRNLSGNEDEMCRLLASTDILVDATQRTDSSRPVIPNRWLAHLPSHAVVCDLSVDPYLLDADPPTVRGIEGIPQGNLDRWILPPDDPAWTQTVPREIPSDHRRTVASCYSWPGIHPEECMRHYGEQLAPLLLTLIERSGVHGLRPEGGRLERALGRASLHSWLAARRSPPSPTPVQLSPDEAAHLVVSWA